MDFLSSLITILPSTWYGYLAAILVVLSALSGALSYLNAGLKPLLVRVFGAPSATDTGWKANLYVLAAWIDILASNTRKVTDSVEFAKFSEIVASHEQTLLKRDDHIVNLTAQLIDSQGTIAGQADTILRQKTTILQTFGLSGQHPDNDNGTTFHDGEGVK